MFKTQTLIPPTSKTLRITKLILRHTLTIKTISKKSVVIESEDPLTHSTESKTLDNNASELHAFKNLVFLEVMMVSSVEFSEDMVVVFSDSKSSALVPLATKCTIFKTLPPTHLAKVSTISLTDQSSTSLVEIYHFYQVNQ